MIEIIIQQNWTDEALLHNGFRPYVRRKQVVMARQLPESEGPKEIATEFETLVAAGAYMICYETGEQVGKRYEDYHRWPVRKDIFDATYTIWDEVGWRPNPPQLHLMSLGCLPYYKVASVWAKRLDKPTNVQSLESPEPALIPGGAWVCIGPEGEPYAVDDATFQNRYYTDIG